MPSRQRQHPRLSPDPTPGGEEPRVPVSAQAPPRGVRDPGSQYQHRPHPRVGGEEPRVPVSAQASP